MGKLVCPCVLRCERPRIMRLRDGRVRKFRKSVVDAGNAHELTFCCYKRLPLLNADRTRQWFVEALELTRQTHDVELWAYVIMPEHVHVLLLPRKEAHSISAILKSLKQSVSRRAIRFLRQSAPSWLDRLAVARPSGRTEHRFWQQGGGYDRNFTSPRAVWTVVNYIHHNPVRRGLVDSATDWLWSSAGWYEGKEDVPIAMDESPPV